MHSLLYFIFWSYIQNWNSWVRGLVSYSRFSWKVFQSGCTVYTLISSIWDYSISMPSRYLMLSLSFLILANLVYTVMFYHGFSLCFPGDSLVEHFLKLAIWIFPFAKCVSKLLPMGEEAYLLPSFLPSPPLPTFLSFYLSFFLPLIISFFDIL